MSIATEMSLADSLRQLATWCEDHGIETRDLACFRVCDDGVQELLPCSSEAFDRIMEGQEIELSAAQTDPWFTATGYLDGVRVKTHCYRQREMPMQTLRHRVVIDK